ncbi:sigma-70 family RNA polymerase sigma factor [Micromonospora sp. KC721]|uniref:sigma-70 family RNA polymerase sigma factor n=1 Tax=Micromonospora sp. KC721 TaxID=2530380 RepID=UPI0010454A92|nr:sigma-70 family RNA polymerase sigma factor [Micromonospora sp. KC721]TDB81953.1 sigma-70 family RNA polymerase sigma factor [Micromonospora sp. KC721]
MTIRLERVLMRTALITAARAGDEQAVAAVVAEAMPLVYNLVGKALSGSPDTDDVVQETMLRVVRGISGLKDPERFRAWVISIAYRQIQDRGRSVRAAAALGPLTDDVSDLPDPSGDLADSTLFRLHLASERREAYEASRWLSPEDQRVLTLWWQEVAGTLTRAELSRQLGLNPAHAAVRVQRVKAQLALARTLLRAWRASPRCDGLTVAAKRLAGPSGPRWLSRLGRHVRGCDRCRAHERELIPAEHLLSGANLAPALAALAASTGATGALGGVASPLVDLLQRTGRYLLAKLVPVGGLVTASAATVFVAAVHHTPDTSNGEGYAPPPAATAPSSSRTATPAVAPSAVAPTAGTPAAAAADGFRGVTTATYFVAPDGSDDNPGGLDRPFATVTKAVSVVRPGETVALRGGRYRPTRPVEITTSGTPEQRIIISNYRSERPVIDASGLPGKTSFVTQRASYWVVQGLEISGAPGHAYLCRSCRRSVFRALSLHDNGRTALLLRDNGTVGNLVVDSDFFHNRDPDTHGETGDGLGIEYGSGADNVVRGCRFYENADDGMGLHEFTSAVRIERSWSFGNGVNRWGLEPFDGDGYGFKLGGGDPAPAVNHSITDSAAWDNAGYGFTESSNAGALSVRGNTAFRNGEAGFAFELSAALLHNNLAVDNGDDARIGGRVNAADNSWDQPGWSAAALVTANPASALAPRARDGSLPRTVFLTNTKDKRIGAAMNPGR